MFDRVAAAPSRRAPSLPLLSAVCAPAQAASARSHCALRLGLAAALALAPFSAAFAQLCDTPSADCEILADRTYTDPNVYDYNSKNSVTVMTVGTTPRVTVNQNGGTVLAKSYQLWNNAYYNMNSGTANISGSFIVAIYSWGAITSAATQSGGTINLGGDLQLSLYNGNTGSYTLNGGNLNVGGKVSLMPYTPIGAAAYVYLNGGTLTTNEIRRDGTNGQQTVAELRFNGGTLRAKDTDNPNWINFNNGFDYLHHITRLSIDGGGAIFDTNGRSMGIPIALPGGGGLTKRGAGTLTLSAANGYGGNTTVEAGTLALANAGAVQPSTVILNGGAVSFVGITGANFGGLAGSQPLALQNTGGAAVALGVGGNGASTSYSGVLSGAGAFAKNGGGTLTFGGQNTHSGTIAVNGGTLRVNGVSGSGALTVANGATLGGSGRVGGAATVQNGGHLAPGNSPGTLTFSSGLSLNNGAVLDLELGSSSDLLRISGGSFAGSGSIRINLADSGGFGYGNYTLIDFSGASLSGLDADNFTLGTTIPGNYLYRLSRSDSKLMLAVTALPPAVTAVSVPADGNYGIGRALDFSLRFSKPVSVTGTPRLQLVLNSGPISANYVSGSGGTDLLFRATVANGNNDPDGIALAPVLDLNGGTLRDSLGTDADLGINGAPSTAGVKIDGFAPSASAIRLVGTPPPESVTINYTVSFSEAVNGVDAADFTVETIDGTATGVVGNVSGSGNSYTVAVKDIGGVGHLFLTLKSSGTGIADLAGNAIVSGFRFGDSFLANVQRRCYVKASAIGANDGSSWTDAYRDLQTAVRNAACVEVWAAKGVYKPGTAIGDSFRPRSAQKLYGGFAGSENSLAERSSATIAANPTVMSGDIDNNDAVDADGIARDATAIVGSNSVNVVLMNNALPTGYGPDTVIDGFVITGGDASNGASGGGLRCDVPTPNSSCSFTLSNLVFSGNRALTGGGLGVSGNSGRADPVISKVLFRGNRATQVGGAATIGVSNASGSASPAFSNVVFSDNRAPNWGGAIDLNVNLGSVTPSFDNVTFSGNLSGARRGGAIASQAFGGGTARPTLRNSILWNNGVDAGDAEIVLDGSGSAVLDRSVVRGGCPGSSTCTNLITIDPKLGLLGDHGGAIASHLPGIDGSAIDAGTCTLADDQRGVARPQGAGCDIGAVEYRQPTLDVTINGDGRVSAGAAPIPLSGAITDCADHCSATYDGEAAPIVTLTATPSLYQSFTGWSGSCSGSEPVTVIALSAAASCSANFEPILYTVSPSVDGGNGSNGSIDPSQPVIVTGGETTQFTLTPDPNYHLAFVDGSCSGALSATDDTIYVTDLIDGDCSVVAHFAIDQHLVTPSVGEGLGTISPSAPQPVDHGAAQQFTLIPAPNYHVDGVDGSCGGNLAGNVYTTNAVTQDCTVVARFAIDQHTLTASVDGGNGTIAPAGAQLVDHGATRQFVLTADANYHIDSVDSSCGGALAGNVYTTGAVTQDCSVVARFAIDQHTLTSIVDGGNGSIAPAGAQLVDYGATRQFTLTPDANYHIDTVGGSCGGTLAGNVYTTHAVTQDCSVVARFAIDQHTLTSSVDGGHGAIAPAGAQLVDYGATRQFTLTPDANYHIDRVDGSCGGALAGNVYTTSAVTQDCSVIAHFAIDRHTVTPSVAGGHGTISPSESQLLDHASTLQFTLTPDANYHVASVDGSCGGSLAGNVYTTAAVTQDCTVIAHFAIDRHTVTPSVAGGHGTISPSAAQPVDHGSTLQLTLTPDANYHIDRVDGSCGGSLAGNVYTTHAVMQDCSVVAHFAIDRHTVTPSVDGGHGTISPSEAQPVDHGATLQFTLTPETNYHVATVDGSCGGTLAGNVYTTHAVTQDCTVVAHFAIDRHTVTPSVAGGHGAISPSEAQPVDHASTLQFTLTPDANYHIDRVDGSCGGALAGNVYTTNAVTQDCTVIAHFAIDRHTVTPSVDGGHGTISPSEAQPVDHGATQQFTLTPETNYHVASVDGSCGGTLAGNVYTTAAVTQDCTVVAHFSINRHTVTPNVLGGHGTISPSEAQTVDHGATVEFSLTPAPHYHLDTVGGSCGGTLVDSTYTTNAIVTDCKVEAHFAIDTHTIGGRVQGLLGSGLVLRLNGSGDTPIAANGNFTLQPALDDLSSYAVTIAQQPSAPTQRCEVNGGSGVLDGSDVTSVVVDCAPPVPHLVLSVSDDRGYARYGRLVNYLVKITNDGSGDAEGLSLRDLQPAQLDSSAMTWICMDGGVGASCTPSGSGPLLDTAVSIPAGRSLAWLVTAPVRPDAVGATVDYEVEVEGPVTANAIDSDLLVLLRSGFDVIGSDGAESTGTDGVCGAAAPQRRLDASTSFAFDLAPGASEYVVTVVRAQAPNGSSLRVERLDLAAASRVRLVVTARDGTERASAWADADANALLVLGIAAAGSEASLLLEGATTPLAIDLPADAGTAFSVLALGSDCR